MAFNNSGFRYPQITPVIQNLIIINALVFLAQVVIGGDLTPNTSTDLFALHHYKSEYFKPHQLITYMFMHAGIFHLVFNMVSLWMFGPILERAWGPKRFLLFYFICGLGAGLAQMGNYIVNFWEIDHAIIPTDLHDLYYAALRRAYTVGASGAIMGVLAGFGYLYPNLEMSIFPIPTPIKAKWAIGGMIALDVFGGVIPVPGDQVAHFAHIGGALIGLGVVLYWNKTNRRTFY